MHRRIVVAVSGLLVGLIAMSGWAGPAAADTRHDFVVAINEIRSGQGRAPLAEHGELTMVAQAWADHLAGTGTLAHNWDVRDQVATAWLVLGENVGVGYDVPTLMRAFVDSPTHYANVVRRDYAFIGVGVANGPDGRIWTSHVFLAPESTATAPAPAPAAAAPSSGRSTHAASTRPTAGRSAPAPIPSADPARVRTLLAELRALTPPRTSGFPDEPWAA